MTGHTAATIRCAYIGSVVRRLAVFEDVVEMHCADGAAIGIPLDTPIRYEAWFMDRGSLTFTTDELPEVCKLCTEADAVTFEDGTEGCGRGADLVIASRLTRLIGAGARVLVVSRLRAALVAARWAQEHALCRHRQAVDRRAIGALSTVSPHQLHWEHLAGIALVAHVRSS